jgi:hypothetical protein
LFAFLAPALAGEAVIFTNDTTIGMNTLSFEGADVVVSNCALTVDGAHSFASLRVLDGGVLTHTFATNGLLRNPFVQVTDQLFLQGTNAQPLSQSNVVQATILVTDDEGQTVFQDGVDYSVASSGALTTIRRVAGSAIPDGGFVTVYYDVSDPPYPTGLNLVIAGDVLVDAGGAINADAKGYAGGWGPGAGASASAGNVKTGGGGGHGGYGGAGTGGAPGGLVYDLIEQPADKGSGGGSGYSGPGGAGGGAIKLVVGGALQLNGQISARGAEGLNPRSGGGAGGGIWLSAGAISGTGTISAFGGSGEPASGGGGGGGRIALYCGTNSFTGNVSARGGMGAVTGGAGTLARERSTAA